MRKFRPIRLKSESNHERQGAKLLGQFLKLLLLFLLMLSNLYNPMNWKKEAHAATDASDVAVIRVRLNYKEEQLNIGDELKLKAKLQYSDQTVNEVIDAKTLKWISSNPTVAKVSSSGKITAKAPGEATITVVAEDGTYKASCVISVKQPYLTKTSLTLYAGEVYWLYVKNGNGKISWKSSDDSIMKVSSTGKVTALKEGQATITATRSGVIMKCKVTIKKVKLSKTSISLYEGQTYGLSIIRTQKEIIWSISNKAVATVSSNGKVTAKAAGNVTITATIGDKSYTCKVTVIKSNLLVGKTKVSLDTKGKYQIAITCIKQDWKKVKLEVENTKILQAEIKGTKQSKGMLSILPKQAGTTKIRIYRTLEPEDVKVIQVTVNKSAISEKPNLIITTSGDTIKSTKTATLQIQNLGTQSLTIYSEAYSYDFDYSGYDRFMKLINSSTGELMSKRKINGGKTVAVQYQIQGKKTWYDKKTKYYIYISYDGLEYEVITSYFLGTTIRLL